MTIPSPLTICLEPPQCDRTSGHLLCRHPGTHCRQVVLIEHRILRGGLQGALCRVDDLVEGRRTLRIDHGAVSAVWRRVVDRQELRRTLVFFNRTIEGRGGFVERREGSVAGGGGGLLIYPANVCCMGVRRVCTVGADVISFC